MFLLAAASPALPIAASLMMGAAAAMAARWLVVTMQTEDLQQGAEWRYDVTRINDLRRADVLYRIFQPIIDPLARLNRVAFRDRIPEMQRQLLAAGYARIWLAEEYLARAEIVAMLLLPLYTYIGKWALDDIFLGVMLGMALSAFTVFRFRKRLENQARRRLVVIKRRMPFLLDLLTLMMEAGATFLQALGQSVEELEGQPVAIEFGRVLTDMSMGKTRTEALESMRARLSDDDVTSVIGAIIQGEELGTPLTAIFRTQSEVLRLKRTQRAEAIAGEAGVKMLLPGVLVMASCILMILGPFILNYFYSGLSF